jgi:hypothetical protein
MAPDAKSLPPLGQFAAHCDAFVIEMRLGGSPQAGNLHPIATTKAAEVSKVRSPTGRRRALRFGTAATLVLGASLVVSPASATGTAHHLPGTTCNAFPADNYWHADVSHLAVDPRSRAWLSHMSPTRRLHPDFGPSYGAQPVPYGIPVTYVSSTHAKVSVTFTYSSESDHVGYPLGTDTKIEGGSASTGDRHAVVVDKSACRLYELWNARRSSTGRWTAGSGATWALTSDALRPAGWTSADAAGLPILPGLLRYDEVRAGTVDHAIRFTTNVTSKAYLWPARHQAGSTTDVAHYPPMGARFRLKAPTSSPAACGRTRRSSWPR